MRIILALVKLAAFIFCVLVASLVQPAVLLFTKGPASYVFPRLWHSCACFIFGIQIRVVGAPPEHGHIFYIANHLSYLDIPVLGSLIKGSFIAKADVEGWALFGFLSKLQQTAFIRRDRQAAKMVQTQLDTMLSDGKDLILFPEGTSTDGRSVRPFKSSMFSLAMDSDHSDKMLIQPITISMKSVDGIDININSPQEYRDLYAWHVEMDDDLDIGKHLWRFAQSKGAVLQVVFHSPIAPKNFTNRKDLSAACFDSVSGGLSVHNMS